MPTYPERNPVMMFAVEGGYMNAAPWPYAAALVAVAVAALLHFARKEQQR